MAGCKTVLNTQKSVYLFFAAAKDVKEKDKDETGSNPEGDDLPTSKPQSAGANVRDAAQRILVLCQKGEWAPVDQVLKSMEKSIAAAGEEANTVPLAGVSDLVISLKVSLHNQNFHSFSFAFPLICLMVAGY